MSDQGRRAGFVSGYCTEMLTQMAQPAVILLLH